MLFIRRKKTACVLFVLILLTVLFIFSQSLLPRAESSEESSRVADLIRKILGDGALSAFLTDHVRKIAHFTEYGVLGAECALLLLLVFRGSTHTGRALTVLFGWATAFLDETIQIFSGRGPEIRDVWIDLSGFVTLFVIFLSIGALIAKIRGKI